MHGKSTFVAELVAAEGALVGEDVVGFSQVGVFFIRRGERGATRGTRD